MGVIKSMGQIVWCFLKAAWGCRTPRCCRGEANAFESSRFWSAASLCRFSLIPNGRCINSRQLQTAQAFLLVALALYSQWGFSAESQKSLPPEFQWPTPTHENRPWTRWWWLGSAVDKTNLTRLLTEYRDTGIGGVEICPIYGAKGYEDRFIDFLSPKWMEMLVHTASECKRLDLGFDLITGTGWPFGGPNVTAEIASGKVVLKRYDVAGREQFKADLPQGQLQCLMAYSDKNE